MRRGGSIFQVQKSRASILTIAVDKGIVFGDLHIFTTELRQAELLLSYQISQHL